MKPKNFFAVCICTFLTVHLTYARWPGMDPHAENYYPYSPYAFTANNPVNNLEIDGKDWYSYQETYTDDDGKEQSRIQYVYKDAPLSNKEMKAQELKWIGITGKTKDGSQYLGLFGDRLDTKTSDGHNNLTTEMISNIDNAIINSYKADYYNDVANRDPWSSEVFSGATDMSVSITVTPAMVSKGSNTQFFNYAGGNVRYNMANNLSGGVFDWGTGKISHESGYTIQGRKGAFATIYRNNATLDVVKWAFPTTQSWQNARNKANRLLLNRKW